MLGRDQGGARAPAGPARGARGGFARLAGNAGWSLADQFLSTATNAGLTVLVARDVSRTEFGAFATAFLLFSLLIAVERSLVGQVLSIRHSAETRIGMRHVAGRALGTVLTLAVPAGLLIAAVGLLLGGPLRGPLAAVGLMMAPLLLQDACRNVFFAQSRPKRAAANDALWAVVQFVTMGVLIAQDGATATTLILAWGGSAAVAAGYGMLKLAAVPVPAATGGWVRQHRDLLGYLLPETLTLTGGDKVALFLVGGLVGVDGVGAMTGARQVFNPLQVVSSAALSLVMPEISRREELGPRMRRLVGLGIGAVLALGTLAYLGVILALPDGVGSWVFGDSWTVVEPVLLPVGLFTAGAGACTGPFAVIAAMGHAKRTFRLNALAAVLMVTLMPLGAWLGGTPGAAWGLCLGKLAEIPLWAYTLFRVAAAGPARPEQPDDGPVSPLPPVQRGPGSPASPPFGLSEPHADLDLTSEKRSPYAPYGDGIARPVGPPGPDVAWQGDPTRNVNRRWLAE